MLQPSHGRVIDHVRRKAGKGLPKNKSWLELPEMIEMLERRRKYS
jgi:hypothetical protein